MMRSSARCLVVAAVAGTFAVPLGAQAPAARVALVLDQSSPRFDPLVEATRKEIQGFFRPGELEFLPPLTGDGTAASLAGLLATAQKNPRVDVVIALGAIGSHLLARGGVPAKPSIAVSVIDAAWQDIPRRAGTSGVRRLVYLDHSYPVESTLRDFHRLIPFRQLAIVLDAGLLAAIPELQPSAAAMVRGMGSDAAVVPARDQAAPILSALPVGTDAVYLTPLPGMSEAEYERLIAGINARRLPTLAHTADPDIRLGALASYEPPENWQRRARRVAVDLQRILAGEDAGTLPVQLVSAPRLTLNVATARAIGFSPGRSLLTDAELAGVDSAGPADTLSLAEAMRSAVRSNLDLAAANLDVASGSQNVRLARSNLLPRIETQLNETFTREQTAAASLGQQPERLLDGAVTLALPLYAEDAWAGYGSEQRLQRARESQRDQTRLDVVLTAAEAYLNVLQARTLADVQRSNLYRTRSNLEVARLRESVGSASRADIYRWQGEVANARRDVISADAQVRIAGLELKRILNRPLERPLAQQSVSLADPALMAEDSTVLAWLDDPARFAVLTDFLVTESYRLSPELASSEAGIAAQRRQLTAAGRAFWLPTFSLSGGASNIFDRGGAGSTAPTLGSSFQIPQPSDFTWQFRLQAALPLFTGFGRSATRAQRGFDLQRLEVQRDAIRLGVQQRVRAAMEAAASSYAAIALSRDAAEAAGRNYELVSDAYAGGTVSITTVLDAQNAALSSAESAANAVHVFLLDLMRVERAMGRFGALQPDQDRQEFLTRLKALKEQP
jgi:outer membrane protein TolC